jgi:hypothetical protein
LKGNAKMKTHHNFRDLKNATFETPPRRARGGRTELVAAGNPDVIAEASGKKGYAKGGARQKGGSVKRAKITGAVPRPRLDRAGRRKFDSGGGAPVVSGLLPNNPMPRGPGPPAFPKQQPGTVQQQQLAQFLQDFGPHPRPIAT